VISLTIKLKMFEVEFDNLTFQELGEYIKKAVVKKDPQYIVTCNVDHLIQLRKDKEFKEVYDNADIITADGMPIVMGSKLLKKPLKEKVSGADIFNELGRNFEQNQYKIFFLGAAEGIAQTAANNLKKKYPDLKIVGTYSPPYNFINDKEENEKIINLIKGTEPDILLVGLGAPKQEKWIYKYHEHCNVPVSIGVGATFDFISGNIKRAPSLFQKTGLEWCWRLMQEPKRLWKRYLVDDTKFLLLLLKEIQRNRKER
jgi:N-acetylglucosaminyldiphosphoundecaprenol N-acetyl-beta-D-mannosaminyltransferase